MQPFFADAFGNPSSLHQLGLRVRDAITTAREQCAVFLNAQSAEEILFASGGTEALNWALKAVSFGNRRHGRHLVATASDHPAVLNSIAWLENEGFHCTRVAVDALGRADPEAFRAALTPETILVCTHLANHDAGTLQRVSEIGAVAAAAGVPFVVDAVAAAGWVPVDVQALGVSLLVCAPHRFYGPKGIGILYRNRRARLSSWTHGGAQEGGRRAGTEHVIGIVGAGAAAALARLELPRRAAHVGALQHQLWNGIRTRIPHVRLHGPEPGAERCPNQLNVSFEFTEGEGLALMLDTQGIAVASGMSCISKAVQVSPVLTAMGVPHALAQAAILLSPGESNTAAEIDAVVDTLARTVERMRGMSPAWDEFQRGRVRALTPA